MKRIAFVISYPLRRELAVGNRILSFLIGVHQRGHEVVLISPGDEPVKLAQMPDRFEHRVIGPRPKGKGGFVGRAIMETFLARKLLKELGACRCEEIFISIPSMFLLFLSPRQKDKLTCLDIRDLTWEYLEDSWFHSLAKRFFRRLARSRIGRFSSVIVTNPSERRYVKEELGVPESKVTMIPNGISTKQFEVLAGVGKKDRKKEEPVVVSYVGNIGLPQNLIVLLQVAKEMPDLIFNIIGAGEDIERIRAYKNKNQISNAHLLGRVQWEEVPEIYSSTDILYAQLSPSFSRALPSKLYEYLSTGKFFVYGGEGQAPEFLSKFENHSVVRPDNADALKHAIEETIRSERHKIHSTENIESIKKSYLRETNVGRWLDTLENQRDTA